MLGTEFFDRVRQASNLGFHVHCVSNGYWAVNKRAASKTVDSVVKAGLNSITLSTGQMHAAYIPPERVIDAAVAAHSAGIEVTLLIEDFKGTKFDWRLISDHPEVSKRSRRRDFKVMVMRWIPNAGGRGASKVEHLLRNNRFKHVKPSRCATVMDTLAVTSGLKLSACCGMPLYYISDLWLGSVESRSLAEVVRDAPFDPIKLWLHVVGPERMLRFVQKYIPDYDFPNSAQICHTCAHLYKDERALRVLRDHYAEVKEEVESAYLRLRARALA